MSKANRLGKEFARERTALLKYEMARQARRRRFYTVNGSAIGAILIAFIVGLVVQNSMLPSTPTLVPKGTVADTAGGIASADGMAIPIGNSSAKVKLTVYEDARCSACKAYETGFTPAYKKLVQDGTLELLIHPVTLIDANTNGSGSLHAGNAFACAQDAGKFEDYHDIIYVNQPDEGTDSFASDATLIALSKQVPGLDTKTFENCVTSHRYFDWVRQNYADLNKITKNQPSTPTFYANGSVFTLPSSSDSATAQAQFTASIEKLVPPAVSPSPSASGSAAASPGPSSTATSSAGASAPASPTPSASKS